MFERIEPRSETCIVTEQGTCVAFERDCSPFGRQLSYGAHSASASETSGRRVIARQKR